MLLGVLALLVLAAQLAGLSHAADLDAHAGADLCHLCQAAERDDTAPTIDATITLAVVATIAPPTELIQHPARVDRTGPPPSRAPPRQISLF